MNAKRVTRYYAECGKGFWRKKQAVAHELNCWCWGNPKNKTCKTCAFAEIEEGQLGCHHNDFVQHAGGPDGVDYISVNCQFYDQETNESK